MFKKIIISLIILITFHFNALASNNFNVSPNIFCDGIYLLNESINEIKNIEVNVNNKRKWTKNILRLSEDENELILRKYKKNFKSKILVNFKNGSSCRFDSKIRIHGDFKDHMIWTSGNPTNSLSVELINGHILNITNFKLFLPKSRNEDNEIFTANFLKHLGYISPRTFYLDVFFNGSYKKFIFQEDLRKEMLENLNRKHGLILEGDERFLFGENNYISNNLQLSRAANSKSWIKKSPQNALIAAQIVNDLNYIYLKDHSIKGKFIKLKESVGDNYLYIDVKSFFNKKFEFKNNFNEYVKIIHSLRANHSLSTDDIRFYYNDLYGDFEPVYYDGHSSILLDWFYKEIDKQNYKNYEPSNTVLSIYNKLDKERLLSELNNSGLNFSVEYLDKILNRIFISLDNYEEKIKPKLTLKQNIFETFYLSEDVNRANINLTKLEDYFSSQERYFDNKIEKLKKIIFFDKINNDSKKMFEILSCNFNLMNCEKENLTLFEFSDLVSQKFISKSGFEYIYVGNNFYDYEQKLFNHRRENIDKYKFKYENDNFRIMSTLKTNIEVDENNKSINIEHFVGTDRTVFFGKELNDWNINFKSNLKKHKKIFNHVSGYHYTGCITFVDLIVNNIEINSENSHCEDSVNFIRTKGSIRKIVIINSFSDAMDADFSNISFDEIRILNAKNDCLDFSFGNYSINTAKISYCGDKSISVGEKSYLKAKNIFSSNSNIAVASKDSSNVIINNLSIENTKICLAAYNKKQEYNGGTIKVKKMRCRDFHEKFLKDKFSTIEIEKSNFKAN